MSSHQPLLSLPCRFARITAWMAWCWAAAVAPAQYLYTVTDLGLYVAQDIYGPATNPAGWAVSTYSSGFPLNSYSLVKRPGDADFSQLFPSSYFFMDAAYGINDKNMVVGATNLFYSGQNLGYRADANLADMLSLTGVSNRAGTDITAIAAGTRILDNGTILGLGRTETGEVRAIQLNPIATELHWDSDGATAGLAQGSGTWSHSSGNWTTNTTGTAVAGWVDGSIARFYYNLANTTVTVTNNIVLEGLWAGYTPYGMTFDASGGGALTFTGQGFIRGAGSSSSLHISAPIAGSAGLWVTGPGGDLHLEGNNTYTGLTRIDYLNDVYVGHANALGATGAGNETMVNGGARVRFDRSLVVGETFVLNGGAMFIQPDYGDSTTRAVELAGPVVLQHHGWIGGSDSGRNATLTVSGVISESGGPWNLQVSGATLTGTNSFTGDLITTQEGVTLSQVTNAGVAGPMGEGTRLVLGQNEEGPTQGDFHYTGATATTNRAIYLEGGGSIDVVNEGTALTLSGLVSGPQGLGKTGAGVLSLTGANTFSGGTHVSAGTLRIANPSGSALGAGPVVVDADAVLTGAGNFSGNLVLSGEYALGEAGTPALIALGGDVTMNAGGWLTFEIGGLTRGTQYDALDLDGLFSSEGSIRLTLINGFMPVLGDSFNLLDWGTGGSITFLDFDRPALTSGLYWDTTAFASTGVISITDVAPAIPEPSTYAMLAGVAALGAAAWRRREQARVSFRTHNCIRL